MIFDGHLELFLESLVAEKGASKNSVVAYKRDLVQFLSALRDKKLKDVELTSSQLELVVSELAAMKNWSERTVARKISAIKSYYGFLLTEGLVKSQIVDTNLPKYTTKLPDVLSIEQMMRLIHYCSDLVDHRGIRLSAIVHMLYGTGIRVSELVSIKMSDIIGIDGCVKSEFMVKGKGDKERMVINNKKSQDAVMKYIQVRHNFISNKSQQFLFCSLKGPITRQQVYNLILGACGKAGIPDISPHSLRHTFGSHMLNGGADLRVIQELLGHQDISTTQIYTQVQNNQMKSAVMRHPFATNK